MKVFYSRFTFLNQNSIFIKATSSTQISSKKIKWKVNGHEKYFQKATNTKWKEIRNGNVFATFKFLEEIDDKVILFAPDKNSFLTIDSESVKFGPSREKAVMNHYYDGKWI